MSIVLVDLLIVAGLIGLGSALVRLILPGAGRLDLAALAFPLGSGIFTWLLFLCSWAGIPLRAPSILTIYALALGLLVLAGGKARRALPGRVADPGSSRGRDPGRWFRLGLLASVVLFVAIAAPLAVGRAHAAWDAAAGWIIKGYGIAYEGDIRAGQTWGAWGLSYPLNIPIQVSLFRVFDGDRLPGSMLVFPTYALSLAAGVYRFWRRQTVGAWQSWLGVLLLLGNPYVLLHSTIGLANLPTTVYVVLGTCWMIEGLAEARRAEMVTGGLLFGLASWTRPEAVIYGLALLPALVILARVVRKEWISPGGALLPFGVLAGVWFFFGWAAVRDSKFGGALSSVLPAMLAGDFRLFELYLIPRLLLARALRAETWGYLFQAAGLLSLAGLPALLRRGATVQQKATMLATVLIAAIPTGVFYIRAFTKQEDFIALLNRSFDRAFLPAATMILVLGVLLFFGKSGIGELSEPQADSAASKVIP